MNSATFEPTSAAARSPPGRQEGAGEHRGARAESVDSDCGGDQGESCTEQFAVSTAQAPAG